MTKSSSSRSSYMKERDAEYRIVKKLTDEGFHYIIRSAASRGPIDLLASNGLEILAVQVKKNGYLNSVEKTRLVEWARIFNAKSIIARNKRGRWKLKPCI